jgi:GDP-L-fucose synthase
MKLLITGSAGMVGKNLLEHPRFQDYKILAPSRLELDLLQPLEISNYLQAHRPDMVIHCAGIVGGIQANIKEPFRFLQENLDLGKNIIQASHKVGLKKLINFGSSCMYPRNGKNPLKEESILQGELEPTNEGYAIAKIVVSKMCEYITVANPKFQYKTIIPCNLYGRWDHFNPETSHMIPASIKKIHEATQKNKTKVVIWGDGMARREFMYSSDIADFTAKAVENFDLLPNILNVGLGEDYTINEYYQTIAKVIGYTGEFVHDLAKPTGMSQKLVDTSRQKAFGWSSKTDLITGIRKTYDFFLENETS